ncbi:MAG: hypothetical protein PVG27_11305 [Chloroflexota bacterium]
MIKSRTTLAGALALALALSATSLAAAQEGEPADPVENPNTGEVSDTLIPQDGSLAVYEEHIRVLNDCDWLGLMAQYPNDAEIHLPGGTVVKGRQAIGELFAGFVLDPADGGLCGITFTEESRFEVGNTQNVQWVAESDFLAEPYRGSDAYVSDGQYMAAMVSTFDGAELVMAGAEEAMTEEGMEDPQGDGTEGAEPDQGESE